MYRVVTLLLMCFLVAGATAQEAETPAVDESPAVVAEETPEASDNAVAEDVVEVVAEDDEASVDEASIDEEEVDEELDIDDTGLDEQTYEEDDDDFIPTEEIPADEPIAFPSNI